MRGTVRRFLDLRGRAPLLRLRSGQALHRRADPDAALAAAL